MAYPGIREKMYLGGLTLTASPSSVTPTWLKAQTRDRARDGSLYVDSLQPETGFPVIMAKLDLSIAWETLCAADIAQINGLISYGGPIDVCYWVPIVEAFYVSAGELLAGSLLRRDALTTITPLPTGAASNYPVTPLRGSGASFALTLGTPSAAGITPWTTVVTSAGETATISYAPVYRMYVAESQEAFSQPHRQGQTLRLEEM